MVREKRIKKETCKQILILGAGFGGIYTIQHIMRRLRPEYNVEITLISDDNYLLFAPMLHEVAMGGVNSRNIAFPIRTNKWRERCRVIQAKVIGIDLKVKKVITASREYRYDYLVLALGAASNESEINVKSPNIFPLKTLQEAIYIRNHIIEMFEQAASEENPEKRSGLLTFVVAGAGYTGVQTTAELRDFVYKDLLNIYKTIDRNEIKIILIEKQLDILGDTDHRLGKYILKYFHKKQINVMVDSRITQCRRNKIVVNDKTTLNTSTVIWVTGVVSNPLIANLDSETDELGRVIVNSELEVPGAPGVYGVGDCIHFVDPKSGLVAPPRAHMAVRQAKVAAVNIISDITQSQKIQYTFSDAPEIITLGPGSAIFRFRKLRIYGFFARLMWMISYSLLITGGHHKRTRIIMDWLLLLLFGRDTTLLKDIKPHEIQSDL